jgi:hypothetical protein
MGGSSRRGAEQRNRWKREDEQHDRDAREERDRWKREDELRSALQKANYTFGLVKEDLNGPNVKLWCANLGLSSFVLEKLSVCGTTESSGFPIKNHSFNPRAIVKAGEMANLLIPATLFTDVVLWTDLEFTLSISTSSERSTKSKVHSFFSYDKGRVTNLQEGFREDREVSCEKCGAIGLIEVTGLFALSDVIDLEKRAKKDLLGSCPNHTSSVVKTVIDLNGNVVRLSN